MGNNNLHCKDNKYCQGHPCQDVGNVVYLKVDSRIADSSNDYQADQSHKNCPEWRQAPKGNKGDGQKDSGDLGCMGAWK